MSLSTAIAGAPGTYVLEDTAGLIPASLVRFNRVYMLGTSSIGTYNEPRQVISVDDFINQFGLSPSVDYVKLFFRNAPTSILYFVRVGSSSGTGATSWTVTVNAVGTFNLTINGVSATITNNGTATTIVAPSGITTTISGTTITVSASNGSAIVIASPSTDITAIPTNQTELRDQFIFALDNAFDPDRDEQGYLIAPEAFASITQNTSRQAVAVAMETRANAEDFDWFAIVDSGVNIANLSQAQSERALLSSAKGHSAYFFPWVTSLESVAIPSSVAVVAIAMRRYGEQGFQQPPAGEQFPIQGVIAAEYKVSKAQQAAVNSLGINCVRVFPNKGVIVFGSRTLSTNPYYRFVNTRIILNVLAGSLLRASNTLVFSAVDGRGVLFTRVRETAEAICYEIWDGGGLYGATPKQAFEVVCNNTNNSTLSLEDGAVVCDVYVATSPTLEKLIYRLTRVAIGQVQSVVAQLNS